jgi:branched-chain amino acid transport system substrate-binding protein
MLPTPLGLSPLVVGSTLAVLTAIPIGAATAPPPVRIGAIYNLTGAQAALDQPSARGARLAVDEANRQGGVLGRTIELTIADGESEAAKVAQRAHELLAGSTPPSAVFGLSDTDMVLAAAPVVVAGGRLFLTSGATSPQLPAAVPDGLFLACFGDNVQAAAAAEWAWKVKGARTAAVLVDRSQSYTNLLAGYFVRRFEALGGKVSQEVGYAAAGAESPPGSEQGTPVDLAAATAQIHAADVVFVAAGPAEAPMAARLLRRQGITAPLLGGDSFDAPDLWRGEKDLADVTFTTHADLRAESLEPATQAFRRAWADAYPGSEPDAFSALGYDTARLLLTAITRAASDDPAKVQAALAAIHDFVGVTGEVDYADGSRIPNKAVTLLRVDGGLRTFVAHLRPAAVPTP